MYVVIVYMSRTTCPLVFALALAACAIHAAIRKPSTALAPPCNEVHFRRYNWDLSLRVRTALLTGHDCRLFPRQVIGYGMHEVYGRFPPVLVRWLADLINKLYSWVE